MAETFKIRKGDEVIVTTGQDKGRKGSVLNVDRKTRRVLVQGVNMVRRHTRPSQGSAGGIIEKEAPVALSNVAIVDPKSGEASRVGYKTLDDGRKVRFAKKSGEVIDL